MSLSDALKEKKLDVRLRDKFLGEGSLEKKEVELFLNELEDDTQNMTYVENEEASSNENEDSSEEVMSAPAPTSTLE